MRACTSGKATDSSTVLIRQVLSRMSMSAVGLVSAFQGTTTTLVRSESCALPEMMVASAPDSVRAGSVTDSALLLKKIAKVGGSCLHQRHTSALDDVGSHSRMCLLWWSQREKKIKVLSTEMETLRQKLQTAVQRVTHMEMEQEQFFEDVQAMKTQYDKCVADRVSRVA